jgi:hypothetical protein
LAGAFAKLVAARRERIRAVVALLQAQAEGEVGRLRSLGWTQSDFARALEELLETKGGS